MNSYLIIGTGIVFFALIFYSIGVITEQLKQHISILAIVFLTVGVLLDITATTFMIIGSSKGSVSLHGFIGYSSLSGMILDTVFMWIQIIKSGTNSKVPKALHLYTRYAYAWWIVAFVSGGIIVAFR
jgi:hypothetical protein